MRRMAILATGVAVWLFLFAIPVFADGGPHIATANNGSTTLTSDNCAGCHRAHTATVTDILRTEVPALCIVCHGRVGLGATTNVEDGIQYTTQTIGQPSRSHTENGDGTTGTELGALRAGGFRKARIDSSNPGRISYPRYSSGAWVASFTSNVPVLASSADVTSRHMNLDSLASKKAWGNGAIGSGAGDTIQLNCTSCHNPHGNGNYRILNPVPEADEGLEGEGFAITNSSGVVVKDALPAATTLAASTDLGGNTRNYTVMQNSSGTGAVAYQGEPATGGLNTLLTVKNVVDGGYSATDGDYFRRYVPWYRSAIYSGGVWTGTYVGLSGANSSVKGGRSDSPTGVTYSGNLYAATGSTPAISDSFSNELTAWCAQCHSRYHTGLFPSAGTTSSSFATSQLNELTGEDVFKFRHGTLNNGCQVCHVAHGSNAQMLGDNSKAETMPDGSAAPMGSTDSRLLKVDNRGTCQQCHDPTGTVPAGFSGANGSTGTSTTTYYGPGTPNFPTP